MSQRSHFEGLSARFCGHAGGLARIFAFSMVFLFALGLLDAQVPQGYWGDVRPVEGVNTTAIEWRPVISHDGLTLIFSSYGSGGMGRADIYMATRGSPGDPFGNVINLWDLNSSENDTGGCLSADGLELFFFSSRENPSVYDQDLYLATREDLGAPFREFRYLDELNTTVHESYPWISADGQRLYFTRYNQGIMVARRGGPGQPFQEVKTVFISPFGEGAPSVSADGSMLFFSDTYDMDIRDWGYGCLDLWMVPLDAPDHSAGPEINLGSPPNGPLCEGYASISADWPAAGATIYFVQARSLSGDENWDIYQATWHLRDCDGDGVPDEEEIAAGTAVDLDLDGIPDECEPDCNLNGLHDHFDLANGTSKDCNANGVPDECEPDCNSSGAPDDCDVAEGTSPDCNHNGLPDECDIASGSSYDRNGNGVPDECEVKGTFVNARNTGFSDGVNTPASEMYPVVSPDGMELYYQKSDEEDIWVATRESLDKPFRNPKNVQELAGPGILINTAAFEAPGCVSHDSREFYFASYRDGTADIFVAKRERRGEFFVSLEKLGEKVNSPDINDGIPTISRDGLTILYHRHRQITPSAVTQCDIWSAERESTEVLFGDANGPWPRRLEFNSPTYDEYGASISSDGLFVFFSDGTGADSRPGGSGRHDIWVTMRGNADDLDAFGEPVNLNTLWPGSTVNSEFIEATCFISADWPAYGSKIYFISNRPGTQGDADIWEATWVPPPPQAAFTADPEVGTAPLEVSVDGSASSAHPGFNIASYEWDFGDGTGTAQGVQGTHTYAEAGQYTIRLTVADDREFDIAESGKWGSATREIRVGCPSGDTGTWSFSDIGEPLIPGSAGLESGDESKDLHICTSGNRIGSTSDECSMLYKEIAGDFQVTARIAGADHVGSGGGVGVMVRESLDAGAITAVMRLYGPLTASPRRARCGYRLLGGESMSNKTENMDSGESPVWVRLERRADTLSAFYSLDGESWPPCGEPAEFTDLPETLLAGVAACKGTATAASPEALQAVITNLEVVPLDPVPLFRRADANADGTADISDAITILGFLFLGGTMNDCRDAADVNDDGKVDISDPVGLLGHLFQGGPAPPAPFPGCGGDSTPDNPKEPINGDLGCNMFDACP